jgi:hypothetical protein
VGLGRWWGWWGWGQGVFADWVGMLLGDDPVSCQGEVRACGYVSRWACATAWQHAHGLAGTEEPCTCSHACLAASSTLESASDSAHLLQQQATAAAAAAAAAGGVTCSVGTNSVPLKEVPVTELNRLVACSAATKVGAAVALKRSPMVRALGSTGIRTVSTDHTAAVTACSSSRRRS